MEKKTICIIMSTCNGGRYLEEQLDSLFRQTYPYIKIFVRDDGSKDNTIKILDKYSRQGKLEYIEGKQLGYGESFIEALNSVGNFDYYAFCDQDDVWEENKIKIAIEQLNKNDYNIPLMYFSGLDICDKDLNHMAYTKNYKVISFTNCFFENIASGNTMVINNKLKTIFLKERPKNIIAHDAYLYMYCVAFGKVLYDKNNYIKYRKHDKSITVYTNGFFKFQIYRIKSLLCEGNLKIIKLQTYEKLIEFERLYGNNLNKQNKEVLSLFTNPKRKALNLCKKVFYPHRYRQTILDEFLLRLAFLFGVI